MYNHLHFQIGLHENENHEIEVVEFSILPLSISSKQGEQQEFGDLESLVIRGTSEP